MAQANVRTIQVQTTGNSSEGEGIWAGGWTDSEGRMRGLRSDLDRFIPKLSLRAVAAVAGIDYAQYSRLEQGQKAWMVPTFSRVAGGLLGSMEWYEQRSMPLHTLFPNHQPRRYRPEPLPNRPLPIAPPADPFCWNLATLLERLSSTTRSSWTLRDLASRLAEAEGHPHQAKVIFSILDRIQRRQSDGSIPTLLRLHRFLAPFLSTPAQPLLLDDILTIHRWRIML